jgi:hypothetical protein
MPLVEIIALEFGKIGQPQLQYHAKNGVSESCLNGYRNKLRVASCALALASSVEPRVKKTTNATGKEVLRSCIIYREKCLAAAHVRPTPRWIPDISGHFRTFGGHGD